MASHATQSGPGPATGAYLDLVKAFPLRPIRSSDEHDRAISTISALADRRHEWGADEKTTTSSCSPC